MTGSPSAPELPKAKTNLVRMKEPWTGRVTESYSCLNGKSNAYCRHVSIDVSGSPIAGNFLPGQSFGVIAPGLDATGKPHKLRLYSLACPSWGEDGEGNVISSTIKRLIDEYKPQKPDDPQDRHDLFVGVCSNYLCDLKVGEEVQVTGPVGSRFLLPARPEEYNYLFLATGTGIAPFRSMIKELLQHPDGPRGRDVHLVMGSPYTTDLMYDDLFAGLDAERANFHYHRAISRERRPDGRRGLYVDGLVKEKPELFRALLEDDKTLIYVCGIAGMQWGIYRSILDWGLGGLYLDIAEEAREQDPAMWDWEELKSKVRPGAHCMVEVY